MKIYENNKMFIIWTFYYLKWNIKFIHHNDFFLTMKIEFNLKLILDTIEKKLKFTSIFSFQESSDMKSFKILGKELLWYETQTKYYLTFYIKICTIKQIKKY